MHKIAGYSGNIPEPEAYNFEFLADTASEVDRSLLQVLDGRDLTPVSSDQREHLS